MLKRKVSPEEAAKKAYVEQQKKNALAKVPKSRFNFTGLAAGYAYGKEKSTKSKFSETHRIIVMNVPAEMIGRSTHSKEPLKVQSTEILPGGVSFPSRTDGTVGSIDTVIAPGFASAIGISKGPWFDNLALGTPVRVYDLNANSSSGASGVRTFVNASGMEVIDRYQGQETFGYCPFEEILHAFADAGAVDTRIPKFDAAEFPEEYPDPGPTLTVAIGKTAQDKMAEFTGKPWPINLALLKDGMKFEYKDKEQAEHPMLFTKYWGSQVLPDGTKEHFILKMSMFAEELSKYGMTEARETDSEMMREGLLPFLVFMPKLVVCNISVKKTMEMDENVGGTMGISKTGGNAFTGSAAPTPEEIEAMKNMPTFGWDVQGISFGDYPGLLREFGIPVNKDFAVAFTNEPSRVEKMKDNAEVDAVAEMAQKMHGVVVMNTRSKTAMSVLEKRLDEAEFCVLIPKALELLQEEGARDLAEAARKISVEESTALVNSLHMDSPEVLEEAKATGAQEIVKRGLAAGLTKANTPDVEKTLLFAILKPKGKLPVYEMWRENVFGLPSAAPEEPTKQEDAPVPAHEPPTDAAPEGSHENLEPDAKRAKTEE